MCEYHIDNFHNINNEYDTLDKLARQINNKEKIHKNNLFNQVKHTKFIELQNNYLFNHNDECERILTEFISQSLSIDFIKKFDLQMISIEFNNGYTIRVAKEHIFHSNGCDIFAKDLKVGMSLDHASGSITVSKIEEALNESCFDISINAPHLYYDANGLVHHNTAITAVLSASVEKYGRSVVIVPNKSLVTQTEADYINMGLDVGVLFGDRKEYFKTHTICTWQSLLHLLKNTQNNQTEVTIQEFLDQVVCVMVDECHSAKADALRTLLSGVFAQVPIRWGLTGTIPKEDYAAQSLFCCIGPLIGKLTASELQEAGYLSNCHVHIKQLVDYVEYKDYQQELKYLLSTESRLDFLAEMITNIANNGNTLVLVDRIEPGRTLASKIKDAVFISGSTKAKERKDEYDEFNTSNSKITVATYGIAAVGINIPRIFNLVILEPGKSFVRVIQSIGRGIRKAEDKDYVNIYDITSTCKFAKRHLTKRKQFYKEAKYEFTVEKIEWQ